MSVQGLNGKFEGGMVGMQRFKSKTVEELLEIYRKPDEYPSEILTEVKRLLISRGVSPPEPRNAERVGLLLSMQDWDALGEIGVPAIEALCRALNDPAMKAKAAETIGKIKDKRATELLMRCLNDEDPYVRTVAVRALCEAGDAAVVEPLIRWLMPFVKALEDGNADAETAAGEGSRSDAFEALDPDDDDLKLMTDVVRALGELKDPRALQTVIMVLGLSEYDLDAASVIEGIRETMAGRSGYSAGLLNLAGDLAALREAAVEALSNIGGSDAVEALLAALRDPHIREKAAGALAGVDSSSSGPDAAPGFFARFVRETGTRKVMDAGSRNVKEAVHFLVDQQDGDALRIMWNIVKAVLLADVKSNDRGTIDTALYAFIGIGNAEILPELTGTLAAGGTKTMAEAFLNCGHEELRKAAESWAEKHGYTIKIGQGAHPVTWGKW
jgi:HEAT repeat protein